MAAISDRQTVVVAVRKGFDPARSDREEWIRVAAYFEAERRGFAPGHELDDWLAAEREIDETLKPLPSY